MFGVRRRNPLADKTRISGLSLHHGFFPLGGCRRLQIRQLQCLQNPARVRAAPADPATLRSILHAKRHQAYCLQRLHPPPRAALPPSRPPPKRAASTPPAPPPAEKWTPASSSRRASSLCTKSARA